jgi:hypothetical protein
MSYGSSSYGGMELAGLLLGAGVAVTGTAPAAFTFDLSTEVREAHTYRQADPVVPFENREARAMPSAVIECTSFIKDPAATKVYGRDWSEILDAGETIATSAWDGGGLTVGDDWVLGEKCYVFLSGGVLNTVYVCGNHIVTSLGREYTRELRIVCEYT